MKLKHISSIIFLGILVGCSNIELTKDKVEGIHTYIPNFPKLNENIVYLSYPDLIAKCGNHKPKGKEQEKVYGCAAIDLNQKTCTIYVPTNFDFWALEHEKEHCKGGDHDGILTDYHTKWLKLQQQKETTIKNETAQPK